jgi:LmbE family N-acetylglucosaminyl deacetylase
LSEVRKKPVLVLAPHPDDETFGCGGTIRMLVDSGLAVDVTFMTRGEMGMEAGATPTAQASRDVAETRTAEAQAACSVLGVRQVRFLGGADTRLAEQPQLAAALSDLFATEAYQRVFCPWPQDSHQDHIATFELLRSAVKAGPSPTQFWLYEVWKPLPANTFVPIDNTIDAKRQAIELYKSQLALCNYQEAFIGLAAYRSLFCAPSRYAEAFLVCDRDEILRLK